MDSLPDTQEPALKTVAASVLIVVAAITALSTLLAAAISGHFVSQNARRSLDHAAEMARLDREAERMSQHRAARRDAYAAFAACALTALRDLHAACAPTMSVADRKSCLITAQAAAYEVTIARGVLEVEGPQEVARYGHEVQEAMNAAVRALRNAFDALDRGSDTDRSILPQPREGLTAIYEAGGKADKAVTAFMQKANAALSQM